MPLASIDASLGELSAIHGTAMKVLLWVTLGYVALYLVALPIFLLTKRTKALRIATGYLYVLPIFLAVLYAAFMIFLAQVSLIQGASDRSMPPHKALQAGLRAKIEKNKLAPPGETDDPYDVLLRSSPTFGRSKFADPARWTVRAAGRVLSVYDLLILGFLLVSLAAAVGPVSLDLLGHPIRRVLKDESAGTMIWTVFKRLFAMVLYLGLGAAVFTLLALLFAWVTYGVTWLSTSLIADVSSAATRAPSLLIFLHILGAMFFLIEMTALLALSMAMLSACTGTALKWRLQGWFIGGATPAGFKDAFAGFWKLIFKLVLVSVVAYLAVILLLFLLPAFLSLPICILLETAGVNLALWRWKAHRDAKRLAVAFWHLHTFGARQTLKK